jgi:hypothetical protein
MTDICDMDFYSDEWFWELMWNFVTEEYYAVDRTAHIYAVEQNGFTYEEAVLLVDYHESIGGRGFCDEAGRWAGLWSGMKGGYGKW